MQNLVVVDNDPAPSPPKCCFWWEITCGPHENAVLTLCLHCQDTDAGDGAVRESLKVGRQKRCWMRLLKDLEVSSVHAEFRLVDVSADTGDGAAVSTKIEPGSTRQQRVVLCDLQSTNGTKINGEPLIPRQEYALADQDLIYFGKTAVRFRVAKSTKRPEDGGIRASGEQESAVGEQEVERRQSVQDQQDVVDLTDDPGKPVGDRTPSSPPPEAASDTAKSRAADPFQLSAAPAQDSLPTSGGGGGFTTDDDVFEAPRSSHVVQLPTRASSSSSPSAAAADTNATTCMICGQWLGHLDVLEQQLHINGCLDGRNQRAENWLLPPQQGSSVRNASTTQNQGKKRKRARGAAASTIEDDEVAMAMAMSKSMANKEQEVGMEIALLSGELAQIDLQMAKLAKKREVLLKKMVKLEKTKAKVQKSVVIPPAEARVLLDLARVLQMLFPDNRRVLVDDCADSVSQRKKARAVAEKYAPQAKQCVDGDSSWRLPSMWLRASQLLFGHTEEDLYRNSILLPFAHMEMERKEEDTECDKSAEANDVIGAVKSCEQEAFVVPDAVKRVFPDWNENLAFLRQQCVQDLEEALQELIQQRQSRHSDEPESEDVTGGSANNSDEAQACAFFESVIQELIASKNTATASAAAHHDLTSSGTTVKEVIVVDSESDSEDLEGALTEDTNAIAAIPDEPPVTADTQRLLETQPDQITSPTNLAMEICDAETEVEPSTERVASTCTQGAVHGDQPVHLSAVASVVSTVVDEDVPDAFAATEPETGSTISLASTTTATAAVRSVNGEEEVGDLLLRALKAHPAFYEMVLLLQPLDVTDFAMYATQEAKIKCTKKSVLAFFDKHGITFKQS